MRASPSNCLIVLLKSDRIFVRYLVYFILRSVRNIRVTWRGVGGAVFICGSVMSACFPALVSHSPRGGLEASASSGTGCSEWFSGCDCLRGWLVTCGTQ